MVACKRKLKQGTNTFDLFFRPKHRVVSKKSPLKIHAATRPKHAGSTQNNHTVSAIYCNVNVAIYEIKDFWESREKLLASHVLKKHKGCKGGWISESTFTLVLLPTKGAKSLSWVKNLNNLFTDMGGKFKFSVQESESTPFIGNGAKVKIPLESKPPLMNSTDTRTSKKSFEHLFRH